MDPQPIRKGFEEAVSLFWSVYRARFFVWSSFRMAIHSLEEVEAFYAGNMPDQTDQQREKREQCLAEIRQAYHYNQTLTMLRERVSAFRIPDQVDEDQDEFLEDTDKFHSYLHTSAALALWLRERDGYSDDVRQVLKKAWRVARLLLPGEKYDPAEWEYLQVEENYPYATTLVAVSVIVLAELFRVAVRDREYEEALHFLALALENCSRITQGIVEADVRVVGELGWAEALRRVNTKIADIDAQEAANLFEELRRSNVKNPNWRRMAEDCQVIADSWSTCCWDYRFGDRSEVVIDMAGLQWDWRTFWWQASGWVQAKMDRDDLSAYLEDQRKRTEDERAKEILLAYFGEARLFNCLPEPAQRALIEAIRAWTSTRLGRPENVLDQIRYATEALLYSVLWEPISEREKYVKDDRPRRFRNIKAKLVEKGFSTPSLVDYGEMLKDEWIKSLLNGQLRDQGHVEFMFRKLPAALRDLREQRNPAAHDATRVWTREETAPLFRRFLGLGEEGVLPCLCEIYAKVVQPVRKHNQRGLSGHVQH